MSSHLTSLDDAGVDDLDDFLAAYVPGRCTLTSAVLEHAARQRRLSVTRHSRATVAVHADGVALPFSGVNGPHTSVAARTLSTSWDGQRRLLEDKGIAVPRSAAFAETDVNRGLRYAHELGWPVTIRSARLAPADQPLSNITDDAGFHDAWQHAVAAYEARNEPRPVLVEKPAEGQRVHVVVVGGTVVAATHIVDGPAVGTPLTRRRRWHARELVDVTDVVTSSHVTLGQLAVEAVAKFPGVSYAGVDLIVDAPPASFDPGAAPNTIDRSEGIVAHVNCAPALVGTFPSRGERRDVAGAILDHYRANPRWRAVRSVTHDPAAVGYTRRTEPLQQNSPRARQ